MEEFVAGEASFVELMDQAQEKLDELEKIRKKIEKNLKRLYAQVEAATAAAAANAPPPPAGSTPAAPATPHSLVKLPEIEMQHYNVGALEGAAKKAIEGIHMTEVNYNMAIGILRDRFGKTEPIRQALYQELRNVPKPANNASSLRNFEQDVEKLCRQLEKMGEDLDNEETLFRLQDKLPNALAKEMVKEKKAAKEWNTTKFREKLNDIVELQEEIERTTSPEKTSQRTASPAWPAHKTAPQTRQGQKPNATRGGTSAIFTATTSNDKQRKDNPKRPSQPFCVFCQAAGHWSTECRKYATVDVRFEQAKKLNLCYRCMNSGHMRSDCRTTRPCFFCKAKDHHSTLCKKQKEGQSSSTAGTARHAVQNKDKSNRNKNKSKKGGNRVFAAAVGADDGAQDEHDEEDEPWMHVGVIRIAQLATDGARNPALLLTSKAEIFNADEPNHKARRTRNYKLKTLGKEVLKISTITNKKPKATPCTKHEVAVTRNDGSYTTILVYALEGIIGEIPTVNVKPSDANPDKPWKIQVTSAPDVDLLIGADKFWDFDIRPADTLSNGMKIVESSVGYMAAGRLPPEMQKAVADAKVGALILDDDDFPCVAEEDASGLPSKRKVEEFIAIESLGITDDPEVSDDDLALQQYSQTTVFDGERYQVAYPKNTPNPEIPDNQPLCKKRLSAFWHKYNKHPAVLQQVANRFQEQEEQKVIERPIAVTGKHVHHLPFQIVLTPHKNTTKMRIVYDAGPVMLPDLCGMVLTLRTGEIVVVGDIEKAFLQISVRQEDRDLTRFLWLKDITKPPADDNIIVYRFTRVVFGIISSPFLLSATINTHLQRDGSELAKEIMHSIYSDNVLILAENEQEAIQKSLAAREIFKGAAMNLREFKSNSTAVNRALGANEEPLSAFLGVAWDTERDCFVLKAAIKQFEGGLTKRIILKQMAGEFDPQGLRAPALLPAKLVFQET
ncbi:Pao retrotransposon peptidase family protein, partial [Aphelenchoides avenae]